MKKQTGFSLLEVMIAAAVMLVIALGVYQLLTTTTKGAGDLEKRLRFRDLVEDIRFQFLVPSLCNESLPRSFQDGEELRLDLSREAMVLKDATLTEYGLKVVHFQLRNVRRLPESAHSLTQQNGTYMGDYRESGESADVFLEVQIPGSNHSLRPVTVARVARLRRTGSVNEDLCISNHEVPGRGGGSIAAGGGEAASPAGTSRGANTFSFDPPEASPVGTGIVPRPPKGGTYNPAEVCWLRDSETKAAVGKARLIEGETAKFSRFPGQVTYLKCLGGRLEETTRAQ